jgi:hypothetical protein
MFKIIQTTKSLQIFLLLFKLNLSRPQKKHVENFIETLIAYDGNKTIAALNKLIYKPKDQSSFTDFFTYSPWNIDQFRNQIIHGICDITFYNQQLSLFENQDPVFICIDDSHTVKPKTSQHFQVTDWQFNSTDNKGFYYGLPFVTCHLVYKQDSTLVGVRPYLRQRTVRRQNRKRKKNNSQKPIPFKSKYTIVKEILESLAGLLPENIPVYVLFDSWYASAKLIQWCRRKDWHIICALKHNRSVKKCSSQQYRQLSQLAYRIRKKDFHKVNVNSSGDSFIRYWVHTIKGRISKVNEDASIFISKRHYNDRKPAYFLCTNLSLNAQQALSFYSKRWAVEVDHLYLKIRLGLGDYRLRSYEGICRYFDLVCLALAFLYWRMVRIKRPKAKTLSDAIAFHRREQQVAFLEKFAHQALKSKDVHALIKTWLRAA